MIFRPLRCRKKGTPAFIILNTLPGFWASVYYLGVSENRGYLILGVLSNKDPTIYGTILGSPTFGNPHVIMYSKFVLLFHIVV